MTIQEKAPVDADTTKNKIADDIADEVPTATASTAAATDSDDDDDNASKASVSTAARQELQSVKPTFGKIYALISNEIHWLFLTLILLVVAEAGQLAVPKILEQAYDGLQNYFFVVGAYSSGNDESATENADDNVARSTMRDISTWMGTAIGVYFFSIVLGFCARVILGILGERFVARLRKQVYDSVLHQEIGFFDEHKTGEIVSRLGSDTQLLQQAISTFAPESLVGLIKSVLSLALMFSINVKLTAMSLAGVLVICCIAIPFGKRLSILSKLYQNILGEAATCSTEALGGIRTVQSFAVEPKELNRYMEKIGDPDAPRKNGAAKPENTYTVGSKKVIVQVSVFTVVFGGTFGFLYCIVWYCFYLVVIEGTLTLGGLTAFQSYVFMIGSGIGQTATNFTQVLTAVGASGRVFYLLERKPKIKNFYGISDEEDEEEDGNEDVKPTKPAREVRKSIIPSTPMVGNIAFENVMFSYPSRPDVLVLNAFNLVLEKDTTTALVGSSGSGKSTVVSLIQRFYDVDEGQLTLDGVDVTHLDISWLRTQIGYVQQEPQLFGMSIRDNLTYGLSEERAAMVTPIELENVCRDANAHEFISSWPEGYDTMVGERGITLSGGQKQRIAIARALLIDCRILLLDEATSALDAESEHEVQMAIENAMVGRTVVVVAHRLSTIQSADKIVVMDNRKIVDVGTHEELLEGCKRYQDLIKRQSTMARDVSSGALAKLLPANFSIDEE